MWNQLDPKLCNACDNHKYIYSGSFLKQSSPPSQFIPSVYSSRNDYGQSKRTTTETPKEPEKYQHMSEDEQKQFVLQKNGNYTLALSNYKNMVLSVFKGNVYCHIWDNRNKNHVSLNLDELAYMLKKQDSCSGHHRTVTCAKCGEKVSQLSIWGAEKWRTMHWTFLKKRTWCWVCSREMCTVTFGTTRTRNMFHWTVMNWCIYYQMKQKFITWQNSYQKIWNSKL